MLTFRLASVLKLSNQATLAAHGYPVIDANELKNVWLSNEMAIAPRRGRNMEWVVTIIGGFVVSALAGTVGWLARGEIYRKRVDAAPTKFTARLTELN